MSNRAHVEGAPDRFDKLLAASQSMAADFETAPFETHDFHRGGIQFVWAGVGGAFDGIIVLQGSINGVDWNDMGNDTTDDVIDVAAGSGLFELKEITVPLYRLRYQKNGNTGGTMTVRARGRGYI